MSLSVEVESIARLDIKPGETLVVNLGRSDVSRKQAEEIAEIISAKLPTGVHVLVTPGGVELTVVAKDEQS